MAQPFKDFIPEGGELDGLGKGFSDFVPAPAVPAEDKEPAQNTPAPTDTTPKEEAPVVAKDSTKLKGK